MSSGNIFKRDNVEVYEVYKEEKEVIFMVHVPKCANLRDESLTPINIMVVTMIGLLNANQPTTNNRLKLSHMMLFIASYVGES